MPTAPRAQASTCRPQNPSSRKPQASRLETTARLDTLIAQWPYPEGVTKLAADTPLERSTCTALSATFPALQELSLPGWAEGAHTALPPGLCSLDMCALIPAPRFYLSGDFNMCHLEDAAGRFTGLRSLSLSACPERHMREVGLSVLTRLTQMTSLTLTAARYKPWGHLFKNFYADYPSTGMGLGLEVWGTLGALPRLAHLCLDVPLEFHSDMPAVAPLPALTHLTLRCCPRMVQGDERRGVQVPVLQVLQLLPVPLASVHLLAHHHITNIRGFPATHALVAEAVCGLGACDMVMDGLPYYKECSMMAPFLPPSLTSFATNTPIMLEPSSVSDLFPHPRPHVSSLDVTTPLFHPRAEGALQLLGEHLPHLTSLTLRRDEPADEARGYDCPPPASDLSQLAKLRQLSIGCRVLARLLAPALSTLPALTRLELNAGGLMGQEVVALQQLSRLRSLQLGVRGGSGMMEPLVVARQMGRLTELVLRGVEAPCVPLDMRAVFALFVPPPARLERLVLPAEMVDAAKGALGGCGLDVASAVPEGAGQSLRLVAMQ